MRNNFFNKKKNNIEEKNSEEKKKQAGENGMKKIDINKDQYYDSDSCVSVPVGFAVLSEANRQGDKLYYACDKIYNSKGNLIIPIDEHFKTIEEISAKAGLSYYISDDEFFRHTNVQKEKQELQ